MDDRPEDASAVRRHVALTPEAGGGSSVVVPSLPGCFGASETVAKAMALAQDAITTGLDGEPVNERAEPHGIVGAGIALAVSEHGGSPTADNRTSTAAA